MRKLEKYPAQMLEVAGDLSRALAKFENPDAPCFHQVIETRVEVWENETVSISTAFLRETTSLA